MTHTKLKLAVLCFNLIWGILLLHNTSVYGQDRSVKFSSLTINDGLSQNDVKSILKDHNGFMWFSTDDGLNRYDGYNFVVYRHDPKNKRSLPTNDVTILFEDKTGNLWVGTSGGGLSLYDQNSQSFTNFTSIKKDDRTLSSPDINSIFQDSKDNIWVGTYSGLNLLDQKTKTFKRFFYTKNRDDIASHHIFAVTEGNDGTLWLGTGGGLVAFNYGTGYTKDYQHSNANSLSNDKIHTLFKDEGGNLYIGTEGNGLDFFDIKKQSFTHFAHQSNNSNSLINNNVFALSAAGYKKVWVGTEDGLDLFDEDKAAFIHYKNEDKSNNDENNSIDYILDSGGILWLGTYESGVRIFDRNLSSFAHFYKHPGDKSGLSNNIVTSFAETGKGFWIGTDGGGLNFFDQSTKLFTHCNTQLANDNHISGDHVLKLLQDNQQNLWISYYDAGLDVLNSKAKKITHYSTGTKPDQISGSIVFGLAADKNGDIWIEIVIPVSHKIVRDHWRVAGTW